MPVGKQLIAEISGYTPSPGALALWWLGQHGLALKAGSATLYIDPYLSDDPGRLVAPLLSPDELVNADVVLGTHDHADHIDRSAWPAIAQASPRARFVVPQWLMASLPAELSLPPARFVGLDDGRSVDLAGVRVSAVPAAHEFLDRDPETGLYPYLGYVLEAGGCTIYHAGDTCIYEGLARRLRRWSLDVMMVPINGRDAKRLSAGCIGNMTYQEAVDLAGTLGPRVVIPAHYDMFSGNREDPQLFTDYARVKHPSMEVCVCDHGTRVELRCDGRGDDDESHAKG